MTDVTDTSGTRRLSAIDILSRERKDARELTGTDIGVDNKRALDVVNHGGPGGTVNSIKRIYNIAITFADTEQSLTLSDSQISGYMVKVREKNAELKVSHVLGESGTNYLTIPKRAVHTDEHSYTNLTIYFQSPVAGVTVEVVTWT